MNKTRIAVLILLLVAVAAASLAPAHAKKKKKPTGPVVVGTDDEGDWGEQGPTGDRSLAAIGDALGQDLVEATIAPADAETLNFVIKVSSLPSSGGIPEITRYVWTLSVDGELLQLDGKFTNYSRGTCDPTAGTCPPPRDPGQGPFLVRGDCTNQGAAVTCVEKGLVHAAFDPGTGTITIPVTLEMLGAKPGSKIANGTQPDSGFTGIWAIPSAWASQGSMPLDQLLMTKIYTVPKK